MLSHTSAEHPARLLLRSTQLLLDLDGSRMGLVGSAPSQALGRTNTSSNIFIVVMVAISIAVEEVGGHCILATEALDQAT